MELNLNTEYRLEHDLVGELQVPAEAYYGIHSLRAKENFPITGRELFPEMIDAIAWIKKACARANVEAGVMDKRIGDAIEQACEEIVNGKMHDQFIVDPVQGGAGTSTNMNANEVIANRAIEILGGTKGDYTVVNPNDHVNCGQSTNDVYPSCGKMALYQISDGLRDELLRLIYAFDDKAEEFDDVVKMGRTQLQDAVPIRLGQEFAAYSAMMRRELRRFLTAREDLLFLNLGGTAIGTGVNAHPDYIDNVVKVLAKMTEVPFRQSSDLIDATQNLDVYVSLSSSLKGCAVALSKICNDLRLMSSGPRDGLGEIVLPARQNGSSIMPGKINPVIPEVVNQIAFRIIGYDMTVSLAAEGGQLELNAFEPIIFDSLIQGVLQLTHGITTLIDHCVSGIVANEEECSDQVRRSAGLVTALCPIIGYNTACSIAKEAMRTGVALEDLVVNKYHLLSAEEARKALDPMPMTDVRNTPAGQE